MNVAPGVVASGLNVPVPPLCTVHVPVPSVGVLPPSDVVVPKAQIVCAAPTVAVVGGLLTVTIVAGELVLLFVFGSGVVEVTLAVFESTALSATAPSILTVTVKFWDSPLGDAPVLENMIVPLPPAGTESVRLQFAVAGADTRLVPEGITSLTTTASALAGPAL